MKDYERRAQEMCESITLYDSDLHKMYEAALDQLRRGLIMHREDPTKWHPDQCDYMMLDCCLNTLPSGREKGTFYALDMGGTNLRVLRAELDGKGNMQIKQSTKEIRDVGVTEHKPKGVLDKTAGATELFDVIANVVGDMMEKEGDKKAGLFGRKDEIPVGFTFSFGFAQPQLDVAVLGQWTKGFETGLESDDPVVGRDVCALTNEALHRNSINARVCCVLNDTTGTMIAAAIDKPPRYPQCLIGLIVGTGINACYFDPEATNYNYNGRVVNVEIGGFDRHVKKCIADAEVDFVSPNRGRHLLEKAVGGLYVPEIVRNMCLHVFQKKAPATMWEPFSLETKDLAAIYAADQNDCGRIGDVMCKWFDPKPSLGEVKVFKQIVDTVFDRSALLIAVQVAALAKKTRRLQKAMGGVTVGVDGSMFTKNVKYQETVKKGLQTVLGEELANLVYFQTTSDGSGRGAACLAATVATAEAA